MKYNYIVTKITTIILTMAITGCANIPSHVIVAPDIITTQKIFHHNKQAQLNVTDMRTANHVIQIMREGEAAILMSAKERLEDTIKLNLTRHWKQQALIINDAGINTISIEIEEAVISVMQKIISYKAQTEIVIKVTVNNGEQTLTSTFNNRGHSEGPLQADIAVLERNFNLRLTALLQQILTNEKINNSLK